MPSSTRPSTPWPSPKAASPSDRGGRGTLPPRSSPFLWLEGGPAPLRSGGRALEGAGVLGHGVVGRLPTGDVGQVVGDLAPLRGMPALGCVHDRAVHAEVDDGGQALEPERFDGLAV